MRNELVTGVRTCAIPISSIARPSSAATDRASATTGSGNIVLATSPTISSPTLSSPSFTGTPAGSATTGTGNVVLATSPTITTPTVAQINDTNSNAYLKSTATASAVDQVTIVNAATANPATVKIQATGTDANINLELDSKGTGNIRLTGSIAGDSTTGS